MDFVKNDSKTFLAENIRCLRKKMTLSQEEFAFKIGLNRGNIASYEKGTAEPKICNLLKIAHFFGVSILDITKRNLQKEAPLHPTDINGNGVNTVGLSQLGAFEKRAEELETVLQSLHCYHCFKMKSLEELPKDMQIMVVNFEKLFEVTQVLLDSHKELMESMKMKCPEYRRSQMDLEVEKK